ncbi:MAG: hypothetical protein IK118_01575 [Clostridia bacterium]|nr:hypothetical protein [Clostridia bacterium]MBR5427011.1 hypothetical protein [Clostridia bacterium]
MKNKWFVPFAVLAVTAAALTGCAKQSKAPRKEPVAAEKTTVITPVDPNDITVRDYSSDPYFIEADRIRGDLSQRIGDEKSPVYLLACFIESCRTPLEGAEGELFLMEAYDESAYREKYGEVYDDCFTVRLCRQFDVGKNGFLQISLEMKFIPDGSLSKFVQTRRFNSVDALGEYAGSSELFGYLIEHGMLVQKTDLHLEYTN